LLLTDIGGDWKDLPQPSTRAAAVLDKRDLIELIEGFAEQASVEKASSGLGSVKVDRRSARGMVSIHGAVELLISAAHVLFGSV
jgi:hypothetical protein